MANILTESASCGRVAGAMLHTRDTRLSTSFDMYVVRASSRAFIRIHFKAGEKRREEKKNNNNNTQLFTKLSKRFLCR